MATIKNLHKAALRIKKAIHDKERIILYGDADLDGVTAVLILEEAIRTLGGNVVAFYFPQKDKEGYGITRTALAQLKKHAPGLLVTADLCISNFEEVKLAQQDGFFVIVVDHHEPAEGVPEADIVVDPKQPGDEYGFKELAACGLAFRLAEALLRSKMSRSLRKSLVELACLGTIADMMPRLADNREIIDEGLGELADSWRPGIRAFFAREEFSEMRTVQQKAGQLTAVLNVREVTNGIPGAYHLLTVPTEQEADVMITRFLQKNKKRREKIDKLTQQVRMQVPKQKAKPIIFEGGSEFEYMLLGTVASILAEEFGKPTFLYKKMRGESIGSVRAPSGHDTVRAMQSCSSALITYGGHPQASGFRIKNKNLKDFEQKLLEYYS